LFRITDVDMLFPVLEASVKLVKEELSEEHEDDFSLLLRRTGISPIYEYLREAGKL
jgi:hypothetical protein